MDKPTSDYSVLHAGEVAHRYEVASSQLAHLFAEFFSSGRRVLEIGCGSGQDLVQLHKQILQSYGLVGTEKFDPKPYFRRLNLVDEFEPKIYTY